MNLIVGFEQLIANIMVEDMKVQHEKMVNLTTNIENNITGNYYAIQGSTAVLALDVITSMKKLNTIVQLIEKVNNNLVSINEDYTTVSNEITKIITEGEGNV